LAECSTIVSRAEFGLVVQQAEQFFARGSEYIFLGGDFWLWRLRIFCQRLQQICKLTRVLILPFANTLTSASLFRIGVQKLKHVLNYTCSRLEKETAAICQLAQEYVVNRILSAETIPLLRLEAGNKMISLIDYLSPVDRGEEDEEMKEVEEEEDE
jgi:hypothetical protein